MNMCYIGDEDWVKKFMSYEVSDKRAKGGPRMNWRSVVEKDMCVVGPKREDAKDRKNWRRMSWNTTSQPLRQQGKPS